jgi:uncharacterized circularly permuted ATP-grasp superfamily protein
MAPRRSDRRQRHYRRGFEDDETTVARSSDHDGLVLILEPGRDVDAIFDDRFESAVMRLGQPVLMPAGELGGSA